MNNIRLDPSRHCGRAIAYTYNDRIGYTTSNNVKNISEDLNLTVVRILVNRTPTATG